jgi:hypothetical protein
VSGARSAANHTVDAFGLIPFANSIASKFGVNAQVIEMRLDGEGIWPVN